MTGPRSAVALPGCAPRTAADVRVGGEAIQLGDYTYEQGRDAKHDHLVFTMSGGAVVTYNDARRFGYMTLDRRRTSSTSTRSFAGLGVEPLGDELNAAYLAAGRAAESSTSRPS